MTTQEKESRIQTERDDLTGRGYDGILDGLEAAIRYPSESSNALKTVAIGGVLTLLAFLVVPVVLLAGYVVRVVDRTASGDDSLPEFDEWGELATTGLQAVVIGVAYGLVPAILGGGVVAIGIGVGTDGTPAGLGVVGIVLGGLLWMVLTVGVAYLLPAAIGNFAQQRTLRAGFDIGTLKPIWLSRSYVVVWGTMVLVVVLGGLVATLLNIVPVLGSIAGVFVGFYVAVAAYSVLGREWESLSLVEHTDPTG